MRYSNWALLALLTYVVLGCQSAQKRLENALASHEAAFFHLSAYRELHCDVGLSFAEPVKTFWMRERAVSPASVQALEAATFRLRSTPYRCSVNGPTEVAEKLRSSEIYADSLRKLDTVLCVWWQGFYGDSPLRGWRKGQGQVELIDRGVKLTKASDRAIEILDSNTKVVARLSADSRLEADYQLIVNRRYPSRVRYFHQDQESTIDQILYAASGGRELPRQLWVNLADAAGQPTAYLRLEFRSCQWR